MMQLLVLANLVPSSLILFALMMEVKCSCETSFLTRTTGVTSQKAVFFWRLTGLKSVTYKSVREFGYEDIGNECPFAIAIEVSSF
jgi:hypothetical protein